MQQSITPSEQHNKQEHTQIQDKETQEWHEVSYPTVSMKFKISRTLMIWWTILHLFALLMSYTGVDFFNAGRHHETDKFWPFVEFTGSDYYDYSLHTWFRGIFYEYDWTEFALYVGLFWLIYLVPYIAGKRDSKPRP